MIIETFPALTTSSVDLELAEPRFRGAPLPLLKDRMVLGGPVFTAIDNSYHPEESDL